MLSPIHHMVSVSARVFLSPAPNYLLMQTGALLLLSAHHSERSSAVNPNAICMMLAEGIRGSWHVSGLQGFHTAAVMGAAGPRARMASLIYLQLAVRACVFVHIYISLPLTIHLASFRGALQSQLAVLGFITFISCISLAGLANNASLKHSPA